MNYINKKIKFIFYLFLYFCIISYNPVFGKEEINGDPKKGKTLFKKNCTACHSLDLKKKLIGPPLLEITKKRKRDWLQKWIKNNKSLRDKKDKDAIAIYKEYGGLEMNLFPNLSEKDIDDILSFLRYPYSYKKLNIINNKKIVNNKKKNNQFYIRIFNIGIGIIFFMSLIILCKIYTLLSIIKSSKLEEYKVNKININKFLAYLLENFFFFKKYRYVNHIFVSIFSLFFIYEIWDFLMNLDVNKGYKPKQPIYFSHKIHSGINKINCQYCHSSAKYSKISGIPSTNVCMNCHMTITEYKGDYIEKGKTKEFYDQEIEKIYKSSGWNKETRKYSKFKNPIEWKRIHNMPDFVNFDHSQHIILGEKYIKKIKNTDNVCEACHGKVNDMNEIYMANDFTMSWCINCHRTINIDMNNKYYQKIIGKNNNKEENKIFVKDLGGIECGKCHY